MTGGRRRLPRQPAHAMPPRPTVRIETLVRAPLQAVWDAWVTPDDICAWNAASDAWHTTEAEVDLRAGGRFRSRMEARDGSAGFDFAGTYDVVEPPRRLASALDDGRTVEVTFAPEGDAVRVVEVFEADEEHPVDVQRAGWQAILDRFAAYVEADRA